MTNHNKTAEPVAGRARIHEDSILKVSKEVTIKFIEMGRITPATFAETFKTIHSTIKETVNKD